eukprot:NODE_24556_length_620_cov_2.772819.p2 GENE.NODE_24556_length_620_cov_2.772819~~NODE_24556_length_620_cov_2.772819.p2  ORF type:complete len:64 (-),score=12.31 NODE_24556_length_620_cov_2.772819:17-208(-)
MQALAREAQRVEKHGKGFFYGLVCLDELLYFELPRRDLREAVTCGELASETERDAAALPADST